MNIRYIKADFRSKEAVELLKQADIVVTNPPFSLFREYVTQLIEYEKKLLIIGNMNAVTYKEIFPLIKDNKIWLGVSPRGMTFLRPDGSEEQTNAVWFTNLPHAKRNEELILVQKYKGNEQNYPKYDNYDAIEVSEVKNIPKDYDGVMGVPITFLDKHNPEQFEIVGSYNNGAHGEEVGAIKTEALVNGKIILWNGPVINKQPLYKRILIKRKGKPT
jgi:hypothetical protein